MLLKNRCFKYRFKKKNKYHVSVTLKKTRAKKKGPQPWDWRKRWGGRGRRKKTKSSAQFSQVAQITHRHKVTNAIHERMHHKHQHLFILNIFYLFFFFFFLANDKRLCSLASLLFTFAYITHLNICQNLLSCLHSCTTRKHP